MTQDTTQQALALSSQYARVSTPGLTLDTLNLITALAPAWHQSRWFGLSSPEQAIVLMAKAADLGLPVTAAFDFFDLIENKPALKPVGALALIHRSGVIDVQIQDDSDTLCVVTMKRRDTGFAHRVAYTIDEAKAAGLIKPGKEGSAWARFTKDMLRNRAIGRCARIVAPDILAGLYLTTDFDAGLEQAAAVTVIESEVGNAAL